MLGPYRHPEETVDTAVNTFATGSYAEIDIETNAQAIARCDESESATTARWRDRKDLMQFLRTL